MSRIRPAERSGGRGHRWLGRILGGLCGGMLLLADESYLYRLV